MLRNRRLRLAIACAATLVIVVTVVSLVLYLLAQVLESFVLARYGKDAMTFVNGPEGKPRRLRGLCAKVVTAGLVRPGDRVRVTRPS